MQELIEIRVLPAAPEIGNQRHQRPKSLLLHDAGTHARPIRAACRSAVPVTRPGLRRDHPAPRPWRIRSGYAPELTCSPQRAYARRPREGRLGGRAEPVAVRPRSRSADHGSTGEDAAAVSIVTPAAGDSMSRPGWCALIPLASPAPPVMTTADQGDSSAGHVGPLHGPPRRHFPSGRLVLTATGCLESSRPGSNSPQPQRNLR